MSADVGVDLAMGKAAVGPYTSLLALNGIVCVIASAALHRLIGVRDFLRSQISHLAHSSIEFDGSNSGFGNKGREGTLTSSFSIDIDHIKSEVELSPPRL